jgi:hypothetical protein
LGGVAIAELFNWFRQKRSEEENYRLKLYDKRLAVHQQAFEWIQRLSVGLNDAKPGHLDAPETKQLIETALAAVDWWNGNALYLDPVSRSELPHFFGLCRAYAHGHTKTPPVWQQRDKALQAVTRGSA